MEKKELIARIIKGADLVEINTLRVKEGKKPLSSQSFRRYKKMAREIIENGQIPSFFK